MEKIVTIIFVITALIAACSAINETNIPVEGVEEIKSGAYGNYPESGTIQNLISNSSDFQTEWEKVFDQQHPTPETPDFNFNEYEVVLVMMESKPTGGYRISDIQLLENGDFRTVVYTEIEPGKCFTTQAITRPYSFIRIPKSEKPLQFQKDVEVVDCE